MPISPPLTTQIDSINDQFVEARDEIEYAKEEVGTTYFNESADAAKAAVAGVLEKYQGILEKLRCDPASEDRSMQCLAAISNQCHVSVHHPTALWCSEEERGKLQRSMGMKMEQLRAEVELLDTLHD